MSGKKVELIMRLPQLQNLMKRDPESYVEEFKQQHARFLSELEIFKLRPSKDSARFSELTNFISHVSVHYPEDCKEFPNQLLDLLEKHHPILSPNLRKTLVQALILVRNRGLMEPLELLKMCFTLFRCNDKALRQLLFDYIVADIKNVNLKKRDDKLNRQLQAFLYKMVGDETSEIAAKKSLEVMVELYRRRIWTDERTVNAIAQGVLSPTTKLIVISTNFFLGIDQKITDDDDADSMFQPMEGNEHKYSKKTGKRARHTEKQKKANKKKQREKQEKKNEPLFPAINLLHDPQGLVEKVFKSLKQANQRFEVRLLQMNFISRVVAHHSLLLLPFYTYLQRFIQSHQQHVTSILAFLVQACHDLVPPDEIMACVKAVTHHFISDRCNSEVVALGINTVRAIVVRVPAILSEEGDMEAFVQDMAGYAKSRDKSIVIAARGFINVVKELYPNLLKNKDRGRGAKKGARPLAYGEVRASEGVEGAELLQAEEELKAHDTGAKQADAESDDEEEEIPLLIDGEEIKEEGEEEVDGNKDEGSQKGNGQQEVKKDVRQRIDALRSLSADDFERIRLLKKQKEAEERDPRLRAAKKRKLRQIAEKQGVTEEQLEMEELSEEEEEQIADGLVVEPAHLEGYRKRRKANLEERLESVLKGRMKFKRNTHGGGLTNNEKKRKKNFVMVRKGSSRVSGKLANSEKQVKKNKNKKVKQLKRERRKKRRT